MSCGPFWSMPSGLFEPCTCSATTCSTTTRDDDERQQVVQREEAVERRVVDREAAPQPGDDRIADHRDRREQVGDDGRAPEAHLAPRQHVAHEGGRHHQQQDDARPGSTAARAAPCRSRNRGRGRCGCRRRRRRTTRRSCACSASASPDVHVAHDALDRVEGHRRRAACSCIASTMPVTIIITSMIVAIAPKFHQ